MKKAKIILLAISFFSIIGAGFATRDKRGWALTLYINTLIGQQKVCTLPTLINGYTTDPGSGGASITYVGSFSYTYIPCPTIILYENL